MRKKFLALLLAFVMVLGMLPFGALAVSDDAPITEAQGKFAEAYDVETGKISSYAVFMNAVVEVITGKVDGNGNDLTDEQKTSLTQYYANIQKLDLCEVGTAAPYWLSPAVSAEPPPEPDLHVSAYPAPSAITITVLGQV